MLRYFLFHSVLNLQSSWKKKSSVVPAWMFCRSLFSNQPYCSCLFTWENVPISYLIIFSGLSRLHIIAFCSVLCLSLQYKPAEDKKNWNLLSLITSNFIIYIACMLFTVSQQRGTKIIFFFSPNGLYGLRTEYQCTWVYI